MRPDWLLLGEGHPLDPVSSTIDELVNNRRTLIYAEAAGVGFLLDCDPCDAELELTNPLYVDPVSDPAPWYDPARPDTAGFLGVFGLDLTGTENSTRTAKVNQSLGSRAGIGTAYHGSREMVLRALAVATDDCALTAGLRWLRERVDATRDPCVGDILTLFDCCPPLSCREEVDPCPCDDMETPGGPCWANTYAELRDGPSCNPTWWPSTYGELKAGPPTNDEWCHWVYAYYELKLGADKWTCGSEFCVVPYLRQYDYAAITEGPTILSRHVVSAGAFAEIEITLAAADPIEHKLVGRG